MKTGVWEYAALAWLACLLCPALAWSGLGLPCLPCLGLVQQQQPPAFGGRAALRAAIVVAGPGRHVVAGAGRHVVAGPGRHGTALVLIWYKNPKFEPESSKSGFETTKLHRISSRIQWNTSRTPKIKKKKLKKLDFGCGGAP